MQDNIPDALSAAFERHYDFPWNDPSLRNERLAWRAAWVSAMEQANTEVQAAWIAGQDEVRSQRPVQCLHQIQEPGAVAVSRCYFCSKPLSAGSRYCDSRCWRAYEAQKAPVQAAVDAQDVLTPTMFWDADEPESCQTSINNVVVEVDGYRGLSVGDEVLIQRAVSIPDTTVRITMVPDREGNGDLEWEELPVQAANGGDKQ